MATSHSSFSSHEYHNSPVGKMLAAQERASHLRRMGQVRSLVDSSTPRYSKSGVDQQQHQQQQGQQRQRKQLMSGNDQFAEVRETYRRLGQVYKSKSKAPINSPPVTTPNNTR